MPKFNRALFWAFTVFVLCLFTSPLFAQSQGSTGQIVGTVKDASGALVPGAAIKIVNLATGFNQTATSGDEGLYRFVLLPTGRYRVSVQKEGFGESVAEVEVNVGRNSELNFALTVGAKKEQITVTAEAIEVTRHEEAAFVGAEIISNIPLNGRRFQDVVTTTPTAGIDPSRGGITLTGQRMVNTGSVNVDGADYGQLFFGGIRGGERAGFAPTIPLDSIQEFQIIRSGYTAEFGRSTGGAITAITKSGTNAIHGNGQYVIRPDVAGASNEFYDTVAAGLRSQNCTTCVVNPNPTLQQWGGSVGGPVKKDKLFFFGAYDQQRQRLPHQIFFPTASLVTPTAPTQEAFDMFKGGTYNGHAYNSLETPFTQTNDAWLFLIKGDYQISNRHRFSARYNHSNYQGLNAVSVGTSLAPTLNSALSNNGTEIDKTRTVVGSLDSYFTHFSNELRGQYARETRPRIANAQTPTVAVNAVGTYGTTSFLSTTEYDYRIQFGDNVTWLKGAHTIKFGGEYNHLYANQLFGFNQYGQFGYSNSGTVAGVNSTFAVMSNVISANGVGGANGPCGSATCNPSGHRFDNPQAFYNRQIGNLLVGYGGDEYGGFLQDSWRVRPNFTLNYGLRWDAQVNPKPVANNAIAGIVNGYVFPNGRSVNPGTVSDQLSELAPRVGFAWDPFGNGTTVLRGFGGIYFAATPMILYSNTMGDYREPPANVSISLPISIPAALVVNGPGGTCPAPCNTVWKQLNYLAGVNLDNSTLDNLPIITPAQVQAIGQAIATAQGISFNKFTGANLITTANGFHNPRSYQTGFSAEHEMSKAWTVGVEGTWIKTVYLQRDLDLNLPLAVRTDVAGRPIYGLNSGTVRPLSTAPTPVNVGQIILRDSSAKSLYRGVTFRSTVRRRWAQFNAYYTLSESISNDDNERDASGFRGIDEYNFSSDYGYSDLNHRHQFVANPVINLPYRFEVSSALRLQSGAPANAIVSTDLNEDKANNDRPYVAVGVPYRRNSFTDRATAQVDLNVTKGIKISESKEFQVGVAMFNIIDAMNLTYGTSQRNLCTASVAACGIPGGAWSPNPNFLKLRQSTPGSATFGQLLTSNNAGVPFEAQFTARFVF